jgi:hypothetical protein
MDSEIHDEDIMEVLMMCQKQENKGGMKFKEVIIIEVR